MKSFYYLIQKEENISDFPEKSELFLEQSQVFYSLIKQKEWILNEKINFLIVDFKFLDNFKILEKYIYVLIGSVEFCIKVLSIQGLNNITPINIPEELNQIDFVNRVIYKTTFKQLKEYTKLTEEEFPFFIKPYNKIKLFDGSVIEKQSHLDLISYDIKNDNEEIVVSSFVKMLSEWRVIVYKNDILHIGFYKGNIEILPSIYKIKEMIKSYSLAPDCPICYCLDVYVSEDYFTYLVEINDIWASGLYGCNNMILINALSQRIYQLLNNKNFF